MILSDNNKVSECYTTITMNTMNTMNTINTTTKNQYNYKLVQYNNTPKQQKQQQTLIRIIQ